MAGPRGSRDIKRSKLAKKERRRERRKGRTVPRNI